MASTQNEKPRAAKSTFCQKESVITWQLADGTIVMTEPETPEDILPLGPLEIAICGDLTEREADITEKILDAPPGSECVLYFNSPGGAAYTAYSLASLLILRNMNATGIVVGECSSAALWIFAACRRRLVTPHSVLLFHPMKWQSEEHVIIAEAAEWARHFQLLENDMDDLLAQLFGVPLDKLKPWLNPGRYVTGAELVAAGLAQPIGLAPLPELMLAEPPPQPKRRK
jgi:ATP-dependent Clp protease protease subunit